jgi:outer membrane protein
MEEIMINQRYLAAVGASVLALNSVPTPAAAQDHVVAGPGAVAGPAYEGADSYRILPIPILDISHGILFLDTVDGLGVDVVKAGPVTIGGSIGYVAGYRRRDAPDGIGRLANAAGGRLFATYRKNGVQFTIGGTQSVGGTHGVTADATLSYTAKIGSRLSLTPAVATTWADRKYNDGYFGVDAAQSQASGLAAFAPGSGFKDVSAGMTAKFAISHHWIAITNGSARGILAKDADSPIVERRWRPLGSFGIAYAF